MSGNQVFDQGMCLNQGGSDTGVTLAYFLIYLSIFSFANLQSDIFRVFTSREFIRRVGIPLIIIRSSSTRYFMRLSGRTAYRNKFHSGIWHAWCQCLSVGRTSFLQSDEQIPFLGILGLIIIVIGFTRELIHST